MSMVEDKETTAFLFMTPVPGGGAGGAFAPPLPSFPGCCLVFFADIFCGGVLFICINFNLVLSLEQSFSSSSGISISNLLKNEFLLSSTSSLPLICFSTLLVANFRHEDEALVSKVFFATCLNLKPVRILVVGPPPDGGGGGGGALPPVEAF